MSSPQFLSTARRLYPCEIAGNKWTFEGLCERFGETKFGVSRPTGGNLPMRLADYVDYMMVRREKRGGQEAGGVDDRLHQETEDHKHGNSKITTWD